MKLDLTDWNLLEALDADPKMTTSALAKTLRVSQQVADYRLKQLQQKKVITQISALIHLPALGFEQYRLFFRYAHLSAEDRGNLIEYLANHNAVLWAARIGGKFDLHVGIAVRDYHEFDAFVDDLCAKFPEAFLSYESMYVAKHLYFQHKFLSEKLINKKYTIDCVAQKYDPDEIDWKILHAVKANARISSVALGKECFVSYKTVLQRIKKLEEKKIIAGYRVFVTLQNHQPFLLLMRYKKYAKEKEIELLNYLAAEEQFTQVIRQFGSWELLVHARATSTEELHNALITLRENFDFIGEIEVMPVFEDIAIDLLPVGKVTKM